MDSGITAVDDVSVHHFGVIVANIERYLENSLWRSRGAIVHDPLQGARLCLVGLYPDMSPAIELVEPVGDGSPLREALKRGTSWHHLCLSAPTTARADELIREHRFLPVTDWTPAVLFDGRPVRFVYSRNRELVEFLAEAGA
jgi:methylmalonyl-CoA/ethylmalonyl-CoA epimerase